MVVLAAVLAGLCTCQASSASTGPTRIAFGVVGGNTVPLQVTIERTGGVHASGVIKPGRRRLSRTDVEALSRLLREDFGAGLESRQCAGTSPDVGSDFVRAYGRTVSVHGTCEPRFQKLWATLARAVDLGSGSSILRADVRLARHGVVCHS
jgi:hypothetical protein